MPHTRPIVIVEDDIDDQELLREVFQELTLPNTINFFATCKEVMEYLFDTIERPLLIISDINLPGMTGLDLKQKLNENEQYTKKQIPFIFLSTNVDDQTLTRAYDLTVQGIFKKPSSMQGIKETIKMIIDYWKLCLRP